MRGVLPNYLVAGTMKSGTTAFSHMLREHPDIYMHKKELHFFNRSAYELGLDYYRTLFADYQGEAAVGERTATYCYHPLAPQRIAADLPGVKLIFVFRNPTFRAYSHYWFVVQQANDHLSFRQAIAAEPHRSPREARRYGIPRGYQMRGEYVRYVRAFLEYIPRERMYFVLHEALKQEPAPVLAACCRFLDVADGYTFTSQQDRVHSTYMPKARLLHVYGSKVIRRLFFLSEPVREQVMRNFWKISLRQEPGYPPLEPEMKEQLDRHYAPYNAELAELTGLDLSLWQ